MLDREIGWAVARQIYQTLDGGRTWRLIKSVTWDGQFSFVSAELGWAVARSGEERALVQTADGGRTWQLLDPVVGAP